MGHRKFWIAKLTEISLSFSNVLVSVVEFLSISQNNFQAGQYLIIILFVDLCN
jgi:hypothetical protein